jgi:Tol biopolymer transport system component/DNA-binding winged helix-turn-helix (wHTH) protein
MTPPMISIRARIRFGDFELDLHSQELRKKDRKIRLSGQPFQVLRILLETPGDLVTRDQLRQVLWPGNNYGDFDHGLNAAITRLREVLGDSAENPIFIETVPRRGYRFIGRIEANDLNNHPVQDQTTPSKPEAPAARWLRSPWLALILALAVVAAASVFAYRRFSTHSPAILVRPFTTFPGLEINPAFSPDGTRIAFAWDGDSGDRKGFDLYVKQIGSEQLLRLTHQPAIWLAAAWSPDGQFIAFVRSTIRGSELALVSALGGPERTLKVLQYLPTECQSLSWSADGRYLAYSVADNDVKAQLQVIDMQNMQVVPIEPRPACVISGMPAFAHDGQKLAFACVPTWGIAEIYLVPRIGAAPRRVTAIHGLPNGLTWSKDSRDIIVAPNWWPERSEADLWRIDADTGRTEALLFAADAAFPAVAPRGDRLAFSRFTQTANIWRLDPLAPSTLPQKLITSTRFQENPKFSPDGRRIAFESVRSGFNEIWMSNSDGSDPVQLTHFNGPLSGSPDWSPDGRKIVFDSREGGHANLYIVDIDERLSRLIKTDVTENSTPGWSRDGSWIYFRSEGTGKPGLFKVKRDGGPATQIVAADAYWPVESFAGGEVYYRDGMKDSHISRVSLRTGVAGRVPQVPAAGWLLASALARNGIYFLQAGVQGLSIHFHDFQSNRTTHIATLPKDKSIPMVGGLALSPDGHSLLYSQIDEQNSDIMLVENFR